MARLLLVCVVRYLVLYLLYFWILSIASPEGHDSDTITAVDEVHTKAAVDESRKETADRVVR